ncbi:hypothetical protein [Sorangium cellulosum]|uniref:Uncharacterized protein n=1 Tax=Sorangium cellulosum TaxID=56 RepID=A0A150QR59_SORCE|nr:hypothetical protein [Sorangium cellulosum]KYF70434.1 hypothetical protein BE15_16225 [Sorangium cellulosum]
MRFAIFSSLLSRSSTARSSLQGLIALSALVVLTGAKGQGCGGVDEPQPPPDPDCGPGFHWETVCSPCDVGEMCEAQCVPDDRCPRGWLEQTTCGGSTPVTTTAGQGGSAGGVGMPVDPGCWTECVPPPPMCPPGTYEQFVCGTGSSTSSTTGGGGWGSASAGGGGWGMGGSPGDAAAAPPPDMCWTECVPVPYCPPGTTAHTVCEGSSGVTTSSVSVGVGGSGGADSTSGVGGSGAWDGGGGAGGDTARPAPPIDGCRTECLPVEPTCPPGTREQTVCDGGSSVTVGVGGTGGGSGASEWGGCWTECIPVEPYCPPGTREQTVCNDGDVMVATSGSTGTGYGGSGGSGGAYPGGGCWTECIPVEPFCPPDTIPATVCEDPMPGTSGSSGSGYGDGDFADPIPGTSGSSGTGYGGSGGAYPGGGCWTECIPVEPYCPPGTTEQTVCSGSGTTGTGGAGGYPGECWTECLEQPTCPPEATVRTICEEPSGGGGSGPVCWTECVLMLP